MARDGLETVEDDAVGAGDIPLGYARETAERRIGFARREAPEDAAADRASGLLTDQGEGHLMTFAPTGAGKGVSCAIPALLSYTGSAVVVDPKGELAAVTARARREMGQEVVILDPFGVSGQPAAALNPLDLIVPDTEDAVDDCMTLAHAVANEIGSKDPFWDERARQLITQMILYVATDSPPPLRNIREVWYLLNQSRREFELTAKAMGRSSSADVKEGAGQITTSEPRVLASIVSSAQRYVDPFRSRKIERSLSRTRFPLEDFVAGAPLSIYLVLPPERLGSHAAILRLWLSTLFTLILRRREGVERETLFLIDEAAQLGRLDEMVTAVTLLRGFGVKTWSFWQDTQQLEATYPGEWRTLFNNTQTQIAFGRMSPMAARGVADLFNVPAKRIYEMKPSEALMLIRGERARTIERLDYRADDAFKARADDNPRHRRPADRPAPTAPETPAPAIKPHIRLRARPPKDAVRA